MTIKYSKGLAIAGVVVISALMVAPSYAEETAAATAYQAPAGVIHVVQKVINDNGGTAVSGDFTMTVQHRDSVFRHLGEVKIGDLITVKTKYGVFVYEVHKIRIVKANDRTVIVPTKDAILTLSTCYPFYYVGSAPKRYIVQAGLAIGEPIA